jgi:hypothetical protein
MMMLPTRAILALAVLLAGCSPDPRIERVEAPDTLPPVGEVDPGAERARPGDVVGTADAGDATARELHDHVSRMRATPPPLASALEEHAARAEELLRRAERDLQGMAGMAGPAALGMSAEAHALVVEEIGIARAEARELSGTSEPAVRERLPGHLDRLERIATTLESAAAHLRRP